MKRRLISVIAEAALIFALIASVCGCSFRLMPNSVNSASTTAYSDNGLSEMLFWEVTDTDGAGVLYLLGSIHIADDTIYPFPDTVMSAFQASSCLAVEVDIVALEKDLSALAGISQMLIYPNFGRITEHMPTELYDEAKAYLLDSGSYNIAYDYMVPMAWYVLIDEVTSQKSGLSSDYGVDRYFINLAKDNKTEIISIETISQQYEAIMGMPDELAYMMIREILNDPQGRIEALLTMYEIWKSGDFEVFENYILSEDISELTEDEFALYLEYNYRLLDERNIGMVEKAAELIESGKTCFYIVGAAHMAGETGLIQGLSELGYTVTVR